MKQAASARAMCANSYRKVSDWEVADCLIALAAGDWTCCGHRRSQSQARAAQNNVGQASPGIEPGPAWQGGGVSWPGGQLNITGCRM